jgi:Rrf2 family transcriptional regulator, cysteine metabolism repressor
MKVSTRGRYGLRAMTELAMGFGRGPVLVNTIATNQQISANYIHVLMGALKTAGLVRSVRGRSGGYELARDPGTVSALQVVLALEGACAPVDCVVDGSSCSRASGCVTRGVWSRVAAAIETVLGSVTLASLAEQQQQQRSVPVGAMYYI